MTDCWDRLLGPRVRIQRVLVARSTEDHPTSSVTLIFNWLGALEAR